MASRSKGGLSSDALDKMRSRIDPESIANTTVTGHYWSVYLCPHLGSQEQVAMGVVLKFDIPPLGMQWRFAQPESLRDFYGDQTIEQFRWLIDQLEDVLKAGIDASPAPNTIIFGPRMPFQARSPERAISVLYDAVTGISRGITAPRNHGGISDNPEPTTSEMLRSISDKIGMAAKTLEQIGRATIYRVDHHLITTLDLAPAESCERHVPDVLLAAGKMASKRRHKESMVVCTVCPDIAEKTTAELIERLKMLDVSFVADAQPEELKRKIESMLTNNGG